MILLFAAALGLLAGLMSGGSVKNLARYPLRGAFLPVLAYVVKLGAAALFRPQTGAVAVCVLQYGLLFAFLALHVRRPVWPTVAGAGVLANFLVILLNGGRMPVSAALLADGSERAARLAAGEIYAYAAADEATRLPFLGDVLRLGPSGAALGYASPGDLLLCAGVAILCFQMARYRGAAEKAG